MASIRLLSKQLASQIAAGEVVERPSSVVKELLENAVDAGGSHILCQIKGAGKQLIRVRDDGTGIERDDLPLALAPHATSKIYTVDDLSKIMTLGFRGEALASIASVSKLTLSSRHQNSEDAYAVEVEGPEQSPVVKPCAHPVGTTVDVCELFFNTPARRRFLKSDRTEFMRIKDVFIRTALSHPQIGFELVSDGRSVLKVSKSRVEQGVDLKRTATLLGGDFSKDGISVLAEDPNLMMEGMLLPPPKAEESLPEQIYLFLNNRPIADKLVTHAIKEAFYEVLGQTLPVRCVLYLSVNPESVDVNVHPRKDEVRFHEPNLIHDLIADAVVNSLRKAGVMPCKTEEPLLEDTALGSFGEDHRATFDIGSKSLPRFPQGHSAFFKGGSTSGEGALPKAVRPDNLTEDEARRNISIFKSQIAASNVSANADLLLNKNTDNHRAAENSSEGYDRPLSAVTLLDVVDTNVVLIKVNSRYYLVNMDLFSLKQTAETYAGQVKNSEVSLYRLTMPFSVSTDSNTAAMLKNCTLALSRLGFNIKIFRNRIELVEVPSLVKGCNLESISSRLFSYVRDCYDKKAIALIEDGQCPFAISKLVASYTKRQTLSYEQCLGLLSSLPYDNPLLELEGYYMELNLNALCQKLTGDLHE